LWIGMILWGIGMGTQESIVRAEIAAIIPQDKRGLAFGTFNAIYGISWFVGSALMGLLYDFSLWAIVLFSVLSQLIAVVILFIYRKRKNQTV
ncbi:MAG: MFS transporter, partial [Bacteroidales bacterium]|nr:MFS transporter [Bacteroidales bacterium]